MSDCCKTDDSICPCGGTAFPGVIFNPPGQSAIAYRVGNYTAFRHALLQSSSAESELSQTAGNVTTQVWRPGAAGDLGVQMMEWWAYLADILTFYNERVATQAYLGTADLPESVNRLVKLLGYRPKPGIGATGILAALSNIPGPLTLPRGFQIQSKPGPGKQPQIFEVAANTTVGISPTGPESAVLATGVVAAEPSPVSASLINGNTIIVGAASVPARVGDEVMILPSGGVISPPTFGFATVASITVGKNSSLGPITTLTLNWQNKVSSLASATGLKLYARGQSTSVWQYPADDGIVVWNVRILSHYQGDGSGRSFEERRITGENGIIQLESSVRGIAINAPAIFQTSPTNFQLVTIKATSNTVWYGNPGKANAPTAPQTAANIASISIPTTTVTVNEALSLTPPDAQANRGGFLLWHSWAAVGDLVALPPATAGGASGPNTLQPANGLHFPPPVSSGGTVAQVQDSVGVGAMGVINSTAQLTLDSPAPLLIPPLSVYFNLLKVTRGKTVLNEVLGSGNAALAGQDFALQNAPVTYLSSADSLSGDGYSSTVKVWVNQIQWTEVQSFFGQAPDAQVFVTREDEQGKTHVVFGDGEFGARLPTGVHNVIANYRYGSGTESPAAGSLTVVLKPQPGLRAIRNPIAVGAGADPDPPAKVRSLAPKSVLTFGRAVSADDFQVIASQASGVTRAAAGIGFDAIEQRPRLTVWVGDTPAAVTSARAAIATQCDPNRLPQVLPATQTKIFLTVSLMVDPAHTLEVVRAAVHSALLDPDAGLLGVNVVKIGQAFFDSQIYAACRKVPGVRGVEGINFSEGRFNFLLLRRRAAGCAQHRHDPGVGHYFFLPDDGQALTLLPEAS